MMESRNISSTFDADERDMTKFVIGTISELDTPLTPSIRGSQGPFGLAIPA